MVSLAPSHYTMSRTQSQFSFPPTFSVGNRQTKPFVNTAQVKGHLTLLHRFMEIRSVAENLTNELPGMPSDEDKRRTWLIGLAVER